QRNEICFQAVDAREADENLLSILDTDGIEEEREAERSEHRNGRGLRRKPTHAQSDKEDRAPSQGKPPNVDLAHDVANCDREKERHKRLLFEPGADEFHALSSFASQMHA